MIESIDNTDKNGFVAGVVSVDVLANLLNITPRRIQQLAAEGIIPKNGPRGEYVLAGSIRGYIDFLQRDGLVDENLMAQKLQEEIEHLRLKNRKLQRTNNFEEGELIHINDSREQMAMIAKTGLQILETLPDILERDFALNAEIVTAIESKIDSLRNQWATLLEEL